MDIIQAVQTASQDPQLQQPLQAIQSELSDIAPEQIDELIQLLEFALQNPDQYAEIRAAAIQDDMVDPEDMPEQFDGKFIASMLVVMYKLREGGGGVPVAMARGGLSSMRTLARQGRMGDTMLAHINPEEARMLKVMGGSGTINPNTGLPQFISLKKIVKSVAPVALAFVAPGIGSAIGAALGATGTAAAMLGSAVLGGGMAALTGGNVLQGALLGGLTGGLGGALGSTLAPGLGAMGQQALGGALIGGVAGAATGQGFGKGALQGAIGSALGQAAQGVGTGALGAGFGAGAQLAGNMLTAGFKPKEALLSGALSGLATGLTYKPPQLGTTAGLKPSEAAVENLKVQPGQDAEFTRLGTTNYLTGEQGVIPGQAPTLAATTPTPAGMESDLGGGLRAAPGQSLPTTVGQTPSTTSGGFQLPGAKTLGALALISSLSGQRPPEVQEAVSSLSPQQQEYFNRPSIKWDWNKMQADANAANMSLSQYMATYWPQVTSGAYVVPGEQPPAMAMGGMYAAGGGPLQAVARLVKGGGSGRDDTINARLSDGEYVMDAETVAMLGDGSTDEGARRLDGMRAQLRKHKGKTLAKGKFSPNAKSPLAYLKGAA